MAATSEWSALGGVFYERREIYSLPWGVDVDASRVACAPFGGPVAIVRDDRKIIKNAAGQLRSGTVQIFDAAGAPLGKFLWDRPARLVTFGWTDQEARHHAALPAMLQASAPLSSAPFALTLASPRRCCCAWRTTAASFRTASTASCCRGSCRWGATARRSAWRRRW